MGDSVPKGTQGRISLTDTSLEPSISRTRRTILEEKLMRWEGRFSAMLQRLVAATVWGRNSLLSST